MCILSAFAGLVQLEQLDSIIHPIYLCRLSSKKSEIARVKEEFRSQREETLLEIERLQDALKVLDEEEARKVAELEQEVDFLLILISNVLLSGHAARQ